MNRAEVNASLPTIDIKGKQYVTVDSRVEAFRQLYPNGSIMTRIVNDNGDRCVFQATIMDEAGKTLATGHAFEVQSASYINKTSYLENCETSAVGRALGFLGIGSNGSIASADEVSAAIQQQEAQKPKQAKKAPQKASDAVMQSKQRLWTAIQAYAKQEGKDAQKVLDAVLHEDGFEMTAEHMDIKSFEFESSLMN